MNTRSLIIIDKTLVRFIAIMLNVCVIIVGKILQINHDLDRPFERIIVSKYKGMGSIIQTIPLLQGLRDKYPNATITFVSTPSNKAVLQLLHPLIDNTLYLDDRSMMRLIRSFFPFIIQLIKLRGQVFIDLEIYSNASSIITTLSCASNRFGYFLRSSQYRKGTYSEMLFFNNHAPISQNYMQMGRLLGIEDFSKKISIGLDNKVPSSHNKPYLVINPNASDLRLERRWPKEHFISLIEALVRDTDLDLLLIGSKGEQAYVDKIYEAYNLQPRVFNMAGKTTFTDLINLIRHSQLVITNDTGPMHLSFYYGVSTVALFGPCHPAHYGIEAKNVHTHYLNTYCSPCVHEFEVAPCHGDNICMKGITVASVLLSCIGLLSGQPQTDIDTESMKYVDQGKLLGRLVK